VPLLISQLVCLGLHYFYFSVYLHNFHGYYAFPTYAVENTVCLKPFAQTLYLYLMILSYNFGFNTVHVAYVAEAIGHSLSLLL